jgi:hypothetical protein
LLLGKAVRGAKEPEYKIFAGLPFGNMMVLLEGSGLVRRHPLL